MNFQIDPWAGAANVDVGAVRLPSVGAGSHVLKIMRCLMPPSGDIGYIAEFEVVQSDNPAHAPGSQCKVYFGYSPKFPQYLVKKTKALIAAACGYDPNDPAFRPHCEAMIKASYGVDNPFEGRLVQCDAIPQNKTDPKTGAHYVEYAWTPVAQ